AILAEPDAAFTIHHAAARRGAFGGRWKDRDLSRLRIDSANVLAAENREIHVVLSIGNHIVDIGPRNLKWLEYFELAGLHIEAQHCIGACILQPDFAVHVMMFRTDLIDLDVVSVELRRQTPGLKLLRLLVELRDAALKLHSEPDVFIFVEA